MLNDEGAPCPRPQQGRVGGWAASSVREVLKRPLYRGTIVYGRAKKRDLEGTVRPTLRPESEWLSIDAPHLRIVPPELAGAVDARFAGQRQRALRLSDGRLIGRPAGEGSPYLLTGLLRCGVCGGGMEVLSRKARGRRLFEYRCYVSRRKGPSVCGNKLPALMADTDTAVLRAIESTILHRSVVERALSHAEALILNDRSGEQRAALESELLDVERTIIRLTKAITMGGELAPLVAALDVQERRRKDVEARLDALRAPGPSFDSTVVRQTLEGYLADWQNLLRGHVHQAQQIVRRLIVGRLTLTPQSAGFYAFTGKGTVRPLLCGAIRNLASPPGFEPGFQP